MLPAKAIFWTGRLEAVKGSDGATTYQGKGMLNLFLLGVDRLGFDLSNNSYSVNETLRVLFRIFFPFVVIIEVSLLTRRSEEEILAADRLAARLLTPLGATPDDRST